MNKPTIEPTEWITVGKTDCVVCKTYDADYPLGDCEVVHTPSKPTYNDVIWNGSEWQFAETGDYGGYAERRSDLNVFVAQLKKGKYA